MYWKTYFKIAFPCHTLLHLFSAEPILMCCVGACTYEWRPEVSLWCHSETLLVFLTWSFPIRLGWLASIPRIHLTFPFKSAVSLAFQMWALGWSAVPFHLSGRIPDFSDVDSGMECRSLGVLDSAY